MSHASKIKKERADTGGTVPTQSARAITYNPIIAPEAEESKCVSAAKAQAPVPLKSNGNCKHYDCRYFGTVKGPNRCDYISITGHSRILWHRQRGLSDKPRDCQLHEKGKRKNLQAEAFHRDNIFRPTEEKAFTTGQRFAQAPGRPPKEPKTKEAPSKREAGTPSVRKRTAHPTGWLAHTSRREPKADYSDAVRKMMAEGLIDAEIAKALGISAQSVYRIRKGMGLMRYTPRDTKKNDLQQLPTDER